jgi:hypothetical protein
MVSTRRQKQAVIGASNPRTGDHKVHCDSINGDSSHWRTYGPIITLYSAAVASPATVRLARSCGLDLSRNERLLFIAGWYADLQTLTVLRELGMPLGENLVNAVAMSGRLAILQHLFTDEQCPTPITLSYCAARSGSIDMLEWCKAQDGWPFDAHTSAGAALGGHLAALQYLRREGCPWDCECIASYVASSGSIETLEWLLQHEGIVVDDGAMNAAAGSGQTAMCAHLRSNLGAEWDLNVCDHAAVRGNLDTLRWLRQQGCPWNVSAICMHAGCSGYTDILDFVIEQGEELTAQLLTEKLQYVGSYGTLQTAQWFKQHGAQSPAVLSQGQRPWRRDVLTWARAEGCSAPVTL